VQTATGSASNTVTGNIALGTLGDVRVQRDANQRWLLVARSPDKLWNEVRAFWLDNGFTLVLDQPALGIMETEWNENRGKLPKDGVRRVLGRLFDGLYSTNERDKYRTRLERTADGFTEIFISHKGMAEDFTTSAQEQLKWKVRPVDPELEAEFLKRLMIRLGSDSAAAQAALGAQTAAPSVRAKLTQGSGKSSLLLSDPIDQAWRRVGLSLDRSSFTVEDRDRSKGIYFVRYMAAKTDTPSPGFFARLFGTTAKEATQKYQILLSSEANQTKVSVADLQGVALQTPEATRILQVLADDLK
jgi:outer membrane protein assembly factor BamC